MMPDVPQIYEFESYKQYLLCQIEANKGAHGHQSRLAKAAGCQPSYLSQVLKGAVHLTPEHGLKLAEFWRLNAEETSYLLILLCLERAGTEGLRGYYLAKMKAAQADYLNLGKKVHDNQLKTLEEQTMYSSHWLMSAICAVCSIPAPSSLEDLARRLEHPREEVKHYLNALEKIGFIRKEGADYVAGPINLHLGKGSPLLPLFHRTWRDKAVDDAFRARDSIHYTSLNIIDEAAYSAFRVKLTHLLEEMRTESMQSKAEKVVCLNLDYFKVAD